MTAARYTVLEADHIGIVCLGSPEDVGRLLFQARELDREFVALLTDAGVFFVACGVDWSLREVERA